MINIPQQSPVNSCQVSRTNLNFDSLYNYFWLDSIPFFCAMILCYEYHWWLLLVLRFILKLMASYHFGILILVQGITICIAPS